MADLDIDALIAAQAPQFFDPFEPANNPTPLVLRSLPGEEGRPRGLMGRVLDYAENGGPTPQTGPTAAPAGYQNLDPALASRVLGMVNASDGALPGVRSGFRSYGEQAELYRRYLAGEGAPANPPGHSLHERGEAADVNMRGNQGRDGGAAFISDNAPYFGLKQPYAREPWHVEVDPAWQGPMPSVATGREAVASAAPQQRQESAMSAPGRGAGASSDQSQALAYAPSTSQGKSMDEDLITGSVPPTSSPLSGLLGGLFTGGGAPRTIGGLGGLGGMPDQSSAGGGWRDMLRAMSMALMSSPGNSPFQNLPTVYNAMLQERARADDRRYNREKDRRDFDFRKAEADQAQSNANRQFTLAQQQANRREQPSLQPIKDAAGNVIGTFNPLTGETKPIGSGGAAPAAPTAEPSPTGMPPVQSLDATDAPQAAPAARSPAPAAAAPPRQQVGPNGMPIIPGVRTLVSKEDRRAFGIPDEDSRVYQVDGAGKVTSAGGQNITINSGEKSYDSTINKSYADRFIDMQKEAAGARGQTDTLHILRKQMETPGFRSGAGAEFELGVRRGLTALGIGDPNVAASAENFNKFANKAIMDGLGGSLGSGVSNADRDFIKNTVPNLGNTPEGNRQIIETMIKMNERKAQVALLARRYAAAHGGRIDAGFDDELEKWAEANPIFPKPPEKAESAPRALPQGYSAQGALDDARKAIAAGKDRNAVIERLKSFGVDTSGL